LRSIAKWHPLRTPDVFGRRDPALKLPCSRTSAHNAGATLAPYSLRIGVRVARRMTDEVTSLAG
jgi:hypothetical protein